MPPQLLFPQAQALLALADGTVFRGISIGASGHTVGEVVFNTALTGYQEILTDPSYCKQIVTLTYPHVGSYGISEEDVEASRRSIAAGLIIKDLPLLDTRNFRSLGGARRNTSAREGTVAIAEHRHPASLTRILRTNGAQNGCIVALPLVVPRGQRSRHVAEAVAKAKRRAQNMSRAGPRAGRQLNAKSPTSGRETEWRLGRWLRAGRTRPKFHVVAYDFGVKFNILRMLAEPRLPRHRRAGARRTAADVLASSSPDGVFLSATALATRSPATTRSPPRARFHRDRHRRPSASAWATRSLALASGAKTFKMKFGHHGANHPVRESGRPAVVSITSQNHGFAVDAKPRCPPTCVPTHVSLFDGTLQGPDARTDKPAFCFQGHPEASPGPARHRLPVRPLHCDSMTANKRPRRRTRSSPNAQAQQTSSPSSSSGPARSSSVRPASSTTPARRPARRCARRATRSSSSTATRPRS